MVQELDAAHAEEIAREQHPSGRLSAVPAELLVGQDHRIDAETFFFTPARGGWSIGR